MIVIYHLFVPQMHGHCMNVLPFFIVLQHEIEDLFRFVTFYSYFGLVVVLFICTLFADLKALEKPADTQSTSEKRPLLAKDDSKEEETSVKYFFA